MDDRGDAPDFVWRSVSSSFARFSRCVYAGRCFFYSGLFDVWSRFFQSFAPAHLGGDDELCADCRAFVCVYGSDVREVRFG